VQVSIGCSMWMQLEKN